MVHNKRKIIAIVTSVFMALTVWMIPTGFAAADDITEIAWKDGITGGAIYFDPSTKTITKCDSSVTGAVIPADINGVPVTAIGDSAFRKCDALTSVTIPDSVTTIDKDAFYYCKCLNSVKIGNSVETIGNNAFRECKALTSVAFPASVKSIGSMAFYSCTKLESVEISRGVASIDYGAFGCCNSLKKITVDPNNDSYFSIEDVLYKNDKIKGQTILVQYPIGNNRQSLTIPDGVTDIGEIAFYICSDNLSSVTMPDSIKTIGDKAFYSCDGLTDIRIPKGTETVGEEAFADCGALKSVKLPDSVTSIGDGAFNSCKSLASITVDENNKSFLSKDGVLYDKKQESLVLFPAAIDIESYTIPNGVKTIGNYAFASCKLLTGVTIPDSVTYIGEHAFWGCKSLTSITIPKSVTSIEKYAFTSCTALTSITIPESVTSIGYNALDNCKSLTSITVDENNKYYSSKDGVLFNKDRTVLILYPGSNNRKSYIIPDSVTTIEDGAFESCEFLTGILIPDSVTSIEPNSFPWIETLTLFANKGSYAEQNLAKWFPFKTIITAAPSKVSTNLYKNYDTLKVSWSKVAGADGYYVCYKKSTWKSYQKLGTTTALSYSKAKLTDGAQYKFAVYPYMNIGDQKYMTKNSKSSDYVYTLKKLNKPGVKKSSRSFVRVSWNNIPGESGYQIARSKSSTKNFKIVKRVSKNYKSTKIKTPRYKKYYYKVRAYKTVNGKRIYGPWSSGKSYRLI